MKINRIKIFFATLFLSAPIIAFAQSSSVYSSIGIGDPRYSFSSISMGMGQTGVSLAESDNLELINPATWYKLNRTRFNLGISYRGISLKDNITSGYNDDTQIDGFTLGFPISQELGIGAAIGMVPYSNIGYKIVNDNPIGAAGSNNTSRVTYEGKGGLSKTFIGASYKLPFDVVLGATLDYYFGKLNYTSNSEILGGTSSSIQYTKSLNPSGLGTTFGFLTPDLNNLLKLKDVSDFRLGVSFNYFSSLRTDSMYTSTSTVRTDTMSNGTAEMKIPTRISAGLSLAISKKYLLSLDIVSQPWENFSYAGAKSDELRNAFRLGGGFEYRPIPDLGDTFWEQVIWRAGLSYEQTQYKINNTGINQVAVSGGMSIPISYANFLDLDFQYALRGTTSSGLVKENVFTFNLGINLGDVWFLRRAY